MKDNKNVLIINPNSKYVIWDENIEGIKRDTKLIVQPGCVAMYLVNGKLKSNNTPGQWLIKSKEEDKSKALLQLICVNTDKTFDICCGVGKVPFKDSEINCEAFVGAFGECKIRVSNAWNLYTVLGHSNVTPEEVDEYVKLKINELMTSRLSEVLQHYDYDNVLTQQSKIASDLEKQFSTRLFDLGLDIESFALAGINFDEEYLNKRKEYFEEQNRKRQEKEDRRARERDQRNEIDNLTSIINATSNLNANDLPQNNENPNTNYTNLNQAIKYCSYCGTKVTADVRYCPSCGRVFTK